MHLDARAAAGGGMLRGYRAGALQWEIHYDDAGRAPPTAGSVRRPASGGHELGENWTQGTVWQAILCSALERAITRLRALRSPWTRGVLLGSP